MIKKNILRKKKREIERKEGGKKNKNLELFSQICRGRDWVSTIGEGLEMKTSMHSESQCAFGSPRACHEHLKILRS